MFASFQLLFGCDLMNCVYELLCLLRAEGPWLALTGLLLHRLLSSSSLRQVDLFIMCCGALLLWRGVVRRAHLSLLTPLQSAAASTLALRYCSSEDSEL